MSRFFITKSCSSFGVSAPSAAQTLPYSIAAFAGSEPSSVTCSTSASTRSLRRRFPSVSHARSASARMSESVSFGTENCFLGFSGLASGFFAAGFFAFCVAFDLFFFSFAGSTCNLSSPIFSRSASSFSR